jgi:hypothetical protein
MSADDQLPLSSSRLGESPLESVGSGLALGVTRTSSGLARMCWLRNCLGMPSPGSARPVLLACISSTDILYSPASTARYVT